MFAVTFLFSCIKVFRTWRNYANCWHPEGTRFSKGLSQRLIRYRNIMFDIVHCVSYIWFSRRLGSWLYSGLQVIGCHFTDTFLSLVTCRDRTRDHSIARLGRQTLDHWCGPAVVTFATIDVTRPVFRFLSRAICKLHLHLVDWWSVLMKIDCFSFLMFVFSSLFKSSDLLSFGTCPMSVLLFWTRIFLQILSCVMFFDSGVK
jgi:hypothetical protein